MTTHAFFTHILALGLLTSQVTAHGYVQGIVADGVFYQGYRPSFQYEDSPPQLPGWSDPANINNGGISNYTSPDIICHLGATPGQTYATVQAGGSIELQWTQWPVGHLGPVITYLANCNGECTDVDKNNLLFNKIDEKGLIQGGYSPGRWAADELIANNNSWTLTIPSTIAAGDYVLRHEIIALQEGQYVGGAQNYPQCVNIRVTGSGTNSLPSGTRATQLYTSQDPGILINIYQALSNYSIPGPPLLTDTGNDTQPGISTTTSVPSSNATTTTGMSFYTSTTITAYTTPTTLLTTTTLSIPPTISSNLGSATTTTTTTTTTTSATITSLVGAAFFAAPTTLQTSTRFDTSSSSSTSTAEAIEVVGGYSGAIITVTVTESGSVPTTPSNTTQPWTTGTGYTIINGSGTRPTNSTAYSTSTLTAPASMGSTAAVGLESVNNSASISSTGTSSGSTYLSTVTGSAYGFIGVPIDNGFKRRNARQFYRERR